MVCTVIIDHNKSLIGKNRGTWDRIRSGGLRSGLPVDTAVIIAVGEWASLTGAGVGGSVRGGTMRVFLNVQTGRFLLLPLEVNWWLLRSIHLQVQLR